MSSNKIIIFFILSVVFLSGTITTTVHATENPGILMLFCGNNPINNKYNVDGISAGNIIDGCKERLDGYSWGSRIYILIYAPGWNTDPHKLDIIGNNPDNPITARSREGSMSLEGDGCNGFIETAPDHGLFFGSVKLSGVRMDINGDGRPDVFGGNRCHKGNSIIDDGSGRVEAKQEGGVTVSFEYSKDKLISKSALYSWREATLEFDKTEYEITDEIVLTLTDLDNLRWPFDDEIPYEIHIYSDTDTAGVLADAYWVPNYKGIVQMNGHYPIKFNLTYDDESEASSNPFGEGSGLLRVSPGDTIYAKYVDRTLPRPNGVNDDKKILASSTVINHNVVEILEESSIIESTNQIKQIQNIPQSIVPDWVKEDAMLWSDGEINNYEFVKCIGHLLDKKISRDSNITSVPIWIKNNAEWWSEGKITDVEFVNSVKYMVSMKIIKI